MKIIWLKFYNYEETKHLRRVVFQNDCQIPFKKIFKRRNQIIQIN